jgi:S1-C subfamily serine protease
MARLKSLALGVAIMLMGLATRGAQHKPEVIERGKKATAFVPVVTPEGQATGSAFCIDRSGLFITNAHVIGVQ